MTKQEFQQLVKSGPVILDGATGSNLMIFQRTAGRKSKEKTRSKGECQMTKQEFQQLVKSGPVILDGATGSNLMKAGMPRGICTEKWVCENPEPLTRLQQAYKKAGSQIVYASTFSANRISLGNYGLENQVKELNTALMGISRNAVGKDVLVAGDLTTTGKQEISYEELLEAYKEQILALVEAGADLLVAETMMGITECMAAIDAAASVCELPVMCTLTVESDGSLFFGYVNFRLCVRLQ